MAENIGGHLFLLEEAARVYRDNPSFGFKDIFAAHTMRTKAVAIFKELSKEDQKTVKDILQHKKPSRISEYLLQTGLVKNDGKIGLQYWQYMTINLSKMTPNLFEDMPYQKSQLTYTEEKLLELFQKSKDIVLRGDVAAVLWEKDGKEEEYSDWVIDQAIHRLREKLLSSQMGYEIKTVKGKGFILSSDSQKN